MNRIAELDFIKDNQLTLNKDGDVKYIQIEDVWE